MEKVEIVAALLTGWFQTNRELVADKQFRTDYERACLFADMILREQQPNTDPPPFEEKKVAPKNNDDCKTLFGLARLVYPGRKRGLDTEYAGFVKKHKDHRDIVGLLLPAIQAQIDNRKVLAESKVFVPEWKNFSTWINQRCWEETVGETSATEDEPMVKINISWKDNLNGPDNSSSESHDNDGTNATPEPTDGESGFGECDDFI